MQKPNIILVGLTTKVKVLPKTTKKRRSGIKKQRNMGVRMPKIILDPAMKPERELQKM